MIIEAPSPCHAARTKTITAIIIHDTQGHSLQHVLKLYSGAGAKESMHYVIAPDGNVFRCVEDSQQAMHVENGNLHGERDINNFSIGITIIVDGPPSGEKYNAEQFDSLITLCTTLLRDYRIPLNRVVGHDFVESAIDPGESFPWFELLNSLGTLVSQEDITPTSMRNGDEA